MIPGMRPVRRSARTVPLPARERAAALIRLTVAIVCPRLKPCNERKIPRQPPGVPVKPRSRAYSGASPGKQEIRAGSGAARVLGGECRPDALSRRYIDARSWPGDRLLDRVA